MYRHFFKRFLDFWIALVVLILFSPILLMLILWIGHPRPLKTVGRKWMNWGVKAWLRRAFFTQERPGKDGKIFRILKFKTMTDDRDANGELLPDEQRLTRVGRIVRSTSIDELPQLVNVVKGEMSLIGPRPLLVQYLDIYTPMQMRRHEIRPGISGWAQCHGRNAITWKEKFEYDVWYVDNLSLWIDIQVVLVTIRNVLMRKDINQEGNATIEPFNGTMRHTWRSYWLFSCLSLRSAQGRLS